MRSKKAFANSATSLILQFIMVIYGFVVPKLIMSSFGSAVNGTISSITQFLGYITLLEAGVGGVVRAALYKPIAENDETKISGILNATEKFFRKLAYIFIGYMLIIACLFPFLVNNEFSWFYSFSLVLIIGAGTFMQYYFGITYQMLLQADQKRYVPNILMMMTVISNTILVVVFIKIGDIFPAFHHIQIVKAATAFVYVVKPLLLTVYVKKHYKINSKVEPDNIAIKQRWDGLGHHIAFFFHTNTDIIVLTFFSKISASMSIKEVSVYSVYYSIVNGIVSVTSAFSSGIESAFGDMIARKEKEALHKNFNMFEFLSFFVASVFFTACAVLIVPFVKVYTRGITDADYIRPLFAYILTLAEAVYCIRIPYQNVTLAAGHYKQTRNGAFAEAGINVVLSVLLVIKYGIIGVAAATLAAMTFRTIQYVVYLSKNILKRSMKPFIKRTVITVISVTVSIFISRIISDGFVTSYFTWAVYAVIVFSVCFAVNLAVNFLLCKKDLFMVFKILKSAFHRIFERKSK